MVNPRSNTRQEAGNNLDQQDLNQKLDNGQALCQIHEIQTQLMQIVMQVVTAMQQQHVPPPPPPPPHNKNRLVEFLGTRPPLLNVTRDPLEDAADRSVH
jgi:hypothetical protein